jgi:hypothetical protein
MFIIYLSHIRFQEFTVLTILGYDILKLGEYTPIFKGNNFLSFRVDCEAA